MTLEEVLKEQNLSDEQIESITGAMKENKIFTASEENLDIRYNKLKEDHAGLTNQHGEATKLIEEMKKSSKGDEELQSKITTYEGQVEQLQSELQQTKLESAIKVALLSEKAVDVDYLTYKLKEKGELELDENDKVKGLDDKLTSLKIQFPTQFETSTQKKIEENKLGEGDGQKDTITKEAFVKMGYQERLKLHSEQPEAYAELAKAD